MKKDCRKNWKKPKMTGKKKANTNVIPIDEEDIAEVVSMMTGIPVKRMVQAETEKLRNMADDMKAHGGWTGRSHSESGESHSA